MDNNKELICRVSELNNLVLTKNEIQNNANASEKSTKENIKKLQNTFNFFSKYNNTEDFIKTFLFAKQAQNKIPYEDMYLGDYEDTFRKYEDKIFSNFEIIDKDCVQLVGCLKKSNNNANTEYMQKETNDSFEYTRFFSSDNESYMKLYITIFKNEYSETYREYTKLSKEILSYLEDCSFVKEVVQGTSIEQPLLVSSIKESSNTSIALLDKNYYDIIKDSLKSISEDIVSQFVSLVPMKYIFNTQFHEYALECLFYNRSNSMGEILNLFENYELHTEGNIKLGSILKSLDNVQQLQFQQIMETQYLRNSLEDFTYSIQSTLESGFDSLSEEIDSYNNSLISSQRNIEMKLSKNNAASIAQLNTLKNMDKNTIKIAKNLIEVKDISERIDTRNAYLGAHYMSKNFYN